MNPYSELTDFLDYKIADIGGTVANKDIVLEQLSKALNLYITDYLRTTFGWQVVYKFKKHLQHLYQIYIHDDASITEDVQKDNNLYPLIMYLENIHVYMDNIKQLKDNVLDQLQTAYNAANANYERQSDNETFKQFLPNPYNKRLQDDLKGIQDMIARRTADLYQNKQSISLLELERIKLQDDLKGLKAKLTASEKSIEDIIIEIKYKEIQILEERNKFIQLNTQNNKDTDIIRELNAELDALKQQLEDEQKKLNEHEQQLEDYKTKLSDLNNNVQDANKEQYNKLTLEKTSQQDKLKDLQIQNARSQEEISKSEEEDKKVVEKIKEHQNELDQANKDIDDINAQIIKISSEIENALKQQISDQEAQLLNKNKIKTDKYNEMQALLQRYNALEDQKADHNKIKDERNKELIELKQKQIQVQADATKHSEILKKITEERIILQQYIDDIQIKINQKKNEIKEQEDVNVGSQGINDTMKTEIERMNADLTSMTDTIKRQQQEINEESHKESSLKVIKEKLEKEITNLKKTYDDSVRKHNQLQQEVAESTRIKNVLQQQQQKWINDRDTQKNKLANIQSKQGALNDQLTQMKPAIDNQISQNNTQQAQNKQLIQDKRDLDEQAKNVRSEIAKYENQIKKIDKQIEDTGTDIVSLMDQITNNKKTIADLQNVNENLVHEYRTNYDGIEKLKYELQESNNKLNKLQTNAETQMALYKQKQTKMINSGVKGQLQQYLVLLFRFNVNGQLESEMQLQDFPEGRYTEDQRLSYILQSFIYCVLSKIQMDFDNLTDQVQRLRNMITFLPRERLSSDTTKSFEQLLMDIQKDIDDNSKIFNEFFMDYVYQFNNTSNQIRSLLTPQENMKNQFLNNAYEVLKKGKVEFLKVYGAYLHPEPEIPIDQQIDNLLNICELNRNDDTQISQNQRYISQFFLDNLIFDIPIGDIPTGRLGEQIPMFNMQKKVKDKLMKLMKAPDDTEFRQLFNQTFRIQEGREFISNIEKKLIQLKQGYLSVIDVMRMDGMKNINSVDKQLQQEFTTVQFSNWLQQRAVQYSEIRLRSVKTIQKLMQELTPILGNVSSIDELQMRSPVIAPMQQQRRNQPEEVKALPPSGYNPLNYKQANRPSTQMQQRKQIAPSTSQPQIQQSNVSQQAKNMKYKPKKQLFTNKYTVKTRLAYMFEQLANAI